MAQSMIRHVPKRSKVYGSSLTIFWAIYGSVYDQPGTTNLYGPEYGQLGAIKRILG